MPIASPHFRIIIVGGGIGGLASAIALRAPDREIIVLEASQMNKEVGAAISIRAIDSLQPNAVKITKSWGIEDELKQGGGAVDSGVSPALFLPFKTSDYDADRLCFHRVDLHECLKRLATDPSRPGNPATIRVASKVLSCDCDSGVVTLENGETIRGDLIVGADGIHSKIRTSVLSKEMTASPTGLSAYRLIIPKEKLLTIPHVSSMMTDREPWTTMLLGRDCRVVMGPCREQQLLSIVALVPDKLMNEQASTSWTAQGSLEDLLKSFEDFPPWIKDTFKACPDISLWQLRDMVSNQTPSARANLVPTLHLGYLPPSMQDPLPTWYKGRTILVGDAAHSMLPLQGQGASQSIEDAEALGHFFRDVSIGTSGSPVTAEDVTGRLKELFEARYERASLIQQYSRQAANPATEAGSNVITM
ncbi:hypothetical protein QFC19_007734 [Naganishia cerealis]|uniref:Uncharacterized protein n=1 Tax=Naganishia cerealis TaxID=610337 RepID=A0ACC2V7U1_9TREE|nr:hypothetical protein QFC19_007734 [Naganishia cerealis]